MPDDGFQWLKYGEKPLTDSPYSRSYYRCANKKSKCNVKKTVDRHVENPRDDIRVAYVGQHNHPPLAEEVASEMLNLPPGASESLNFPVDFLVSHLAENDPSKLLQQSRTALTPAASLLQLNNTCESNVILRNLFPSHFPRNDFVDDQRQRLEDETNEGEISSLENYLRQVHRMQEQAQQQKDWQQLFRGESGCLSDSRLNCATSLEVLARGMQPSADALQLSGAVNVNGSIDDYQGILRASSNAKKATSVLHQLEERALSNKTAAAIMLKGILKGFPDATCLQQVKTDEPETDACVSSQQAHRNGWTSHGQSVTDQDDRWLPAGMKASKFSQANESLNSSQFLQSSDRLASLQSLASSGHSREMARKSEANVFGFPDEILTRQIALMKQAQMRERDMLKASGAVAGALQSGDQIMLETLSSLPFVMRHLSSNLSCSSGSQSELPSSHIPTLCDLDEMFDSQFGVHPALSQFGRAAERVSNQQQQQQHVHLGHELFGHVDPDPLSVLGGRDTVQLRDFLPPFVQQWVHQGR
eukprot:TRINITY_DN3278_c0_g1_i3.p1 TRINITY_DN3278_c0_g1~~TRINITY_DN3278_c0_g1_i3.p1  ORF type:complete len:531 (+),score=89.13 TRINITY_DN3278_c0_g1_i3:74-1666(+)